jgi:hypothetical protein
VQGSFGLKALFYPRPFHPEHFVTPEGKSFVRLVIGKVLILLGKLVRDPSIPIETFMSRVKSIWLAVKSSRRDFERAGEANSLSRFLNITWNYVFKGIVAP